MFDEIKRKFIKGSILTKLIYINVAAFVLVWFVSLFYSNFETWFSLPGSFKSLIYKPWTIVSYMFMHGGFWHLLMNMLWVFWFGTIFLRYFNAKQLLAVFILGGFAGAALHLGANFLLHLNIGIVGASAAAMAIVFAVASYKPNFIIHLLFIGPVKIKYIALVAFVLDIMGIAGNLSSNFAVGDGVAHIAHIGGAFYGLWFGYEMKKSKDITRGFNSFLDSLVSWYNSMFKKSMKVSRNTTNKFEKPKSSKDYVDYETEADNNDKINKILDKISKSGYNSLTKKEKEFLFNQKEK